MIIVVIHFFIQSNPIIIQRINITGMRLMQRAHLHNRTTIAFPLLTLIPTNQTQTQLIATTCVQKNLKKNQKQLKKKNVSSTNIHNKRQIKI